jgi:signal transduction histidine kinase
MEAGMNPHPKSRKRIGIKWKMFMILFAFVSVFVFAIWLFQIQMLHYFYQTAKFNELDDVAKDISKALGDDSAMINIAEESADEFYNDVWIYRINGQVFNEDDKIVYCDGTRDSNGYFIEPNFAELYNRALKNENKYIAMVPMRNFKGSYYEFKIIADNANESGNYPYVAGNIRTLNVIYVNVMNSESGNYVLFQRANISPLGTMISMLENQVMFIGILLVIFVLIMAAIMAKLITKPIEQINKSAKCLAIGKYDTEFSGRGYREIDELSDTLNFAAHELSKNDRLQKELISNVSHDLRTPLTMIKGYSEVMRDIPEENTPENVQIIIDETSRLTDLVNDMLDLSKLQAGSRSPDMREFSLSDMLRDTMHRYEKLTMQDGYSIDLSIDKNAYVIADSTMILQVIYNLINNAINYTGADKSVTVVQTVKKDSVLVSVTDTGEGISEEDIPLIWDRYYKVDKVHRRATVGTGLGLSIVKEILEIHNATYGVNSVLGKGSTFWFELKTSDSAEYDVELIDI